MKTLLFILSISLATTNLFAFSPYRHGDHEEIEKMKIAFLTEKLDLSVEEAQAFWPVYNKYEDTRKELREKYKASCKSKGVDVSDLSDEEAKEYVASKIAYEKAKLEAEVKFQEALAEILSYKKIALLYSSEREFKRHLFKEMKDRSENCGGHGPGSGKGKPQDK